VKQLIAVGILAVSIAAPAMAASTQTVNVSAVVENQLALSMQIRELDADGNPLNTDVAPNMSFGTLVNDGVNAMRGEKAYAVFLAANTSARPYGIKSDMNQLVSGTGVQLPNAMLLKIVQAFSPATNGDIDGDAFDGDPQAAIGSSKPIYTSNSTGNTAVIQLVYAIHGGNPPPGGAPFSGWEGIAPDQPGGTYSTSIVYTLTLT